MSESAHSFAEIADNLLCLWFPKFTSVHLPHILWLPSAYPSSPLLPFPSLPSHSGISTKQY